MKTVKKVLPILLIVMIVVAGIALGFYFGQDQGEQIVEERLGAILDRAYPPPPEIMHWLNGVIKGVYGARIDLEIVAPDDYLPRPDGSPHEKQLRLAVVSSNTDIVLVDYGNPQSDGRPANTNLSLNDLNIGDKIRVHSDENIRDAKKFDVTRVEVIRY